MSTTTILWIIAAVLLVGYLYKRRSRLGREE